MAGKTDETTVLKIKRSVKDPRSKMVSLRLTAQEKESMNRTKEKLKFNSVRALLLFCLHAIKEIHDLHLKGYSLFIKKDGEKEDYRKIELDFEPDADRS